MHRLRELLIALVVFAAGVCAILGYALNVPNKCLTETTVEIKKGAGSYQVAESLMKAGVISHPLLFRMAARIAGVDKKLKAGEYVFLPQISMLEVLAVVNRGKVFYRRLTLAEGLTTVQMLKLIEQEPNLSGEITLKVGEGELLPETYTFVKGDSRNGLIMRAQKAMQSELAKAWKDNRNPQIKNIRQLLIFASLIEKETGVADERADISAVFVNRLRIGMRLQTDPTVIYALTEGKKDLGRTLYKKDLAFDSPYNTYKYYGLPIGPICNPGKKAIMAAAHPSQSDALYFVATGKGGHHFAKSLKEHNKNVSLYKKTIAKSAK